MRSKVPLVTVYITNFNYEKYIEQSIESVLAQSMQNFELIIIDDGSTDKSRDIIEKYCDDKEITVVYQQNKGLNITNNVAMRMARGKYLMRLDADDFLEPNALEVMSTVLENDEELGLIFPDYYYVNADGIKTGQEKRHNFEEEVSLFDQPAHGACTMVRLKFLKELGGYNESFSCQDGYDLWIKFVTHHKVTNVSQPLFSYRRHGNNLTTNEDKILETRKKIKEVFVDQHLDTKRTLCVIPVRNTYIGKINWPLYEIEGESILETKVKTCLEAKKVDQVVVSCDDEKMLAKANALFEGIEKVSVIKRPKSFTEPNETLKNTLDQALSFAENQFGDFESIMVLALEYPFLKPDTIDDSIYTLSLFNADAVLSVRPDNKMYYQHTGHSLKPILDQDKFTKLEREAIYRGAGGITLSTKDNFMKQGKLISGSISHIVVDEKTAFGVFCKFEFDMYNYWSIVTNTSEGSNCFN